jgi:hypothetical protein
VIPINAQKQIKQIMSRSCFLPWKSPTTLRTFSLKVNCRESIFGTLKSAAVTTWSDLLVLLIALRTLTASSTRPFAMSHFGDSRDRITRARIAAITRQIPPTVMYRYRQPMLSSFLHPAELEQPKLTRSGQAIRR